MRSRTSVLFSSSSEKPTGQRDPDGFHQPDGRGTNICFIIEGQLMRSERRLYLFWNEPPCRYQTSILRMCSKISCLFKASGCQ